MDNNDLKSFDISSIEIMKVNFVFKSSFLKNPAFCKKHPQQKLNK